MANKAINWIKGFLWRHAVGITILVMAWILVILAVFAWNYVIITRKFDSSRRWDLPSRIYSDATPILPGRTYPRAILEPKLNHVGYQEVSEKVSRPGHYRYVDGDLEIYLQAFDYPDMEFAPMAVSIDMKGDGYVRSIERIEDQIKLKAVRIEPELITSVYDEVMESRDPVPLNAVPKNLVNAIIAVEDRDFMTHEGISIRGIFRAAVTNVKSGGVRAGGSTLTQQLVKNLFLTHERTVRRKLREILMAIILDARYSKEEILEAYLNEIYLGQNGSVQLVGVAEASRVYFGKRVSALSLGECATLGGMIRSPNNYSPLKNPERARERRDIALKSMFEQAMISEAEYKAAVDQPLTVNRYPRSINSAPYFVDLVLQQLRETYPDTQLKTDGLKIFTTLDTVMQRSAETALEDGITDLKKGYPHIRKADVSLEGVVLTIEPGTGYVKALVGGTNYRKSQFNRAVQARRQPGSLFKPFVYVAAMDPDRSEPLTAASVLDDSPIELKSPSGNWVPQNYDGQFHGPVSVRKALALSYNIPAVRAAQAAGVKNVVELAKTIGIRSQLQAYPSIALGSFEVTPLEIAYCYSVFANGGVKAEPVTILAVSNADGQLRENREVTMKRVIPANLAFVINEMLKDAVTYGTAARAGAAGFSGKFAGKTGTTNNYRDSWFVGYSPRVLSLVWIGFDDNRSTRLSGSNGALPIWIKHMSRVVGMVPEAEFRRPGGIVVREIDPETGMLSTPQCPQLRSEYFVEGAEPTMLCPLHDLGQEDPFAVTPDDLPDDRRSRIRRMLPWLFRQPAAPAPATPPATATN
ncbi:MAG: PBP1A family penicillin-binding protein [Thermoanaerobaculia bacterium]|jgi:penicillin-binding protein 1B